MSFRISVLLIVIKLFDSKVENIDRREFVYLVSTAICDLQVLIKGFGVHLRDLCNSTSLEEFVTIADKDVSQLTQNIICQSPAEWLNNAESHFLSNLDFLKPIRVSKCNC